MTLVVTASPQIKRTDWTPVKLETYRDVEEAEREKHEVGVSRREGGSHYSSIDLNPQHGNSSTPLHLDPQISLE